MFFVVGANHRFHVEAIYLWRLPAAVSASPKKTLLGRKVFTVAALMWRAVYAIYFSCRLWPAWGSIRAERN
jgi:hypothetical protein